MDLKVSTKNTKLGKIPSVSLIPGASCVPGIACFKSGCYAAKLAKLRPRVRAAWENNWKLWKEDPKKFGRQIIAFLSAKKPKYFRWHVAGDIPDLEYLRLMCWIAYCFPKTKFLAFTKNYVLVSYWRINISAVPNLNIVVSRWPNINVPYVIEDDLSAFPQAWMRDPKHPDPHIPANVKECGGNCESCGICWKLKKGQSVVFNKH